MKIIIGSDQFAPFVSGVALAAETLAGDLSARGHEVFVFAPENPAARDAQFKFKVVRFRSSPYLFRPDLLVAKQSKKSILLAVRKIKPDLIHIHDPLHIGTGLLKSAQKENIPIVATVHFNLDFLLTYIRRLWAFHPPIRLVVKKYLKSFYNHCDLILCPSETVKKDLQSWGIYQPIEVISNGVDTKRFSSVKMDSSKIFSKYHLPEKPLILFTGRIDADKNLTTLIEAVPIVLQKIDVHFALVGQGQDLKHLKKLVTKKNLKREVSFLGFVPFDSSDLPRLYQAASLFVIPAGYETQSKVTLEAMAVGLPIVGANAGALPELILDQKNGLLFESKKSHDLAEKIIRVLSNDVLRKKMGESSLKLAAKHSIENVLSQTEACYTGLVRKHLALNQDIALPRKNEKVLVFAPHPDDESIGAGGFIYESVKAGAEVKIVLVTDGNMLRQKDRRFREFRQATSHLGVKESDLFFLNYRDGRLRFVRDGLRKSFQALIKKFSPDIVLCPHPHDLHPDHRMTSQVVEQILVNENFSGKVYRYLIWAISSRRAGDWQKFPLDENALKVKSQAVGVYQSQLKIPVLRGKILSNLGFNELLAVKEIKN